MLFSDQTRICKVIAVLKLILATYNTLFESQTQIKSKINNKHEMATQKGKRKIHLPHQNYNCGALESKASVLPKSYAAFIYFGCMFHEYSWKSYVYLTISLMLNIRFMCNNKSVKDQRSLRTKTISKTFVTII